MNLNLPSFSPEKNKTEAIPPIYFTLIENKTLIAYANKLPNRGIVKKCQDFIYLDVDDRFIHELYTLIQETDIKKPDYFTDGIGAHISIIYPNEKINAIIMAHQSVSFTIEHFYQVQTERKIYFVLTIRSPDLLKIRLDNHLKDKLNLKGLLVPLHLTIAIINR